MNLPSSIQAYFDADKSNNGEALIRTFAPDAVVDDEGQSYAGPQAIDAWWRAAKAKYQHVIEPLEIREKDNGAEVRARVTGQFPGSPATLTFAFRLKGGQITGLEIRRMTTTLAGKVALVTGASKGIGAGIATAFSHAGANVAVGYGRDREHAERVAAEIRAANGRAISVQGDLTKTADIEAMVAKAVATFGPIDILVNNAAVFDFKALPDIDEAHFHYIFNTNVLGLLTTTKVAAANFNAAGGSVINISSLSALGNAPGSAAYSASKAAVNAITKVLALELADRKIRVNGIMPGYFDTEGARAIGVKGSEQEARLVAATPLEKRPGHPSDLSPVAVFLASGASAWMTGEILAVSGGLR